MSNCKNSTDAPAVAIRPRVPSPRNPLLSSIPITHVCGYADALSNCASVLGAIADLFGGNAKDCGYKTLASKQAQYGVWLMLNGVIGVLEAAARIEPSRNDLKEVTAIFTRAETETLREMADARNLSVEELVESLVKAGLTAEEPA